MSEHLRVDLDALRSDSRGWRDAAQVTQFAGSAVEGLSLTGQQLSFAAIDSGLVDAYERIRSKTATLLREATDNFYDTSNALITIADRYEENDVTAARKYQGTWDAK